MGDKWGLTSWVARIEMPRHGCRPPVNVGRTPFMSVAIQLTATAQAQTPSSVYGVNVGGESIAIGDRFRRLGEQTVSV